MERDRVVFHGTVLASLFQETTANPHGFDGLLFGQAHTRTTQTHQDNEEAQSSHDKISLVTAYMSSTSLCSFYNAAGEIDGLSLQSLLKQSSARDPVLGWISFRPGPATNPTMREIAVTHSLPSAVQSVLRRTAPHPEILCLLNLGKDHNEATFSLGYRAFRSNGSQQGETLMPLGQLPVEVTNVGANQGRQRYESFWPPTQISSDGSDSRGTLENTIGSLQAFNLKSQIEKIESSYHSLLNELQGLLEKARQGGADVSHRKAELEKIRSSVC
ncbi:hypothetical protein BSKO_12450 [Bryopsis sp. KO-2023]|nr:hypothetical protein BSKO_12450 [Bryopsis sp. KO-2023]